MNNFPDGQILSSHVKKINECLKKALEGKDSFIENLLGDVIIVYTEETDDDGNCYSILNNDETVLVIEDERYDNHLFYEKRPKYKISHNK